MAMYDFIELNDFLTIQIDKLRKLREQNECSHCWEGDDCMLCGLHMEF
jgi:hypothetical protein